MVSEKQFAADSHGREPAVIIADVDKARADTLSAELPGSSVLKLDITDEAAVNAAFAAIPKLDILVNNAGIGLVASIEETTHRGFSTAVSCQCGRHVLRNPRRHAAASCFRRQHRLYRIRARA